MIEIAAGHIATVVTYLEMRERPRLRPMPATSLRLIRWVAPDLDKYRSLFRRIGEPWLWFSRLILDDSALSAIIHDPGVETFAIVDHAGIEVGLLELDRRKPPEVEIGFFGFIPEITGQGHGRWLMALALNLAWAADTTRVWLHTCTLDHPSALNFYRAQGFDAVERQLETFADPRLSGHLPIGAALHVPVIPIP